MQGGQVHQCHNDGQVRQLHRLYIRVGRAAWRSVGWMCNVCGVTMDMAYRSEADRLRHTVDEASFPPPR